MYLVAPKLPEAVEAALLAGKAAEHRLGFLELHPTGIKAPFTLAISTTFLSSCLSERIVPESRLLLHRSLWKRGECRQSTARHPKPTVAKVPADDLS